VLTGLQTHFADANAYPVEGRGLTYTYAFFCPKHSGTGSAYLLSFRDQAGEPLHGAQTYRLHVPAEAPVRQFWSATAYDRATHALIREAPWPSRSSDTPGLLKNPDGSVDVQFGPKPPSRGEGNWIPTKAGGDFEVLFRFYGPKPELFEKRWRLTDIERLSVH